MNPEKAIHSLRLERLAAACGDAQIEDRFSTVSADFIQRPWVGITCSRLGHDTRLHGEVCRFLSRSMTDCRARDGVLLVAEGSAVEPWALRAADLFGVDVIRVRVGDDVKDNPKVARVVCRGDTIGRDAALIALADRVDAAYVRNSGTIANCLAERLKSQRDASTRVAVIATRESAAPQLIEMGAVGWYIAKGVLSQVGIADNAEPPAVSEDPSWVRSEDQWLVHCTRSCRGPWPGQTKRQYQDALLLGSRGDDQRTPLDTLARILHARRLVAGAIASAQSWPVVCFSAAPLRELLDARCYRRHLQRWDYEPYGIAIRKTEAIKLGIQPVIYGQPDSRRRLDAEDQFRFQAVGNTYDWRREREWRSPQDIDFTSLNRESLRVFVPSAGEAVMLSERFGVRVDVVTVKQKQTSRSGTLAR